MNALRRQISVLLCAATMLCAIGATLGGPAQAEDGSKVPASSPKVSGTELACLEKGSLRYAGKVRPRKSCEIGGLVEDSYNFFHGAPERLGRGGSFARFRIEGYLSESGAREAITWLNWGSSFN